MLIIRYNSLASLWAESHCNTRNYLWSERYICRYEGTVWDDLAHGRGVYTTALELCKWVLNAGLSSVKECSFSFDTLVDHLLYCTADYPILNFGYSGLWQVIAYLVILNGSILFVFLYIDLLGTTCRGSILGESQVRRRMVSKCHGRPWCAGSWCSSCRTSSGFWVSLLCFTYSLRLTFC